MVPIETFVGLGQLGKEEMEGCNTVHYKLATFSRRQKPMCLLGENFQYGLLGEKGCNFIMILSRGEPQPIFSNVSNALENIGFGSPLDNVTLQCIK